MSQTDNLRTAQVYQNDQWVDVPFMDLKKGDIFRLVEPNGVLADGGEEAIADTDAYLADGVSVVPQDGAPLPAGVMTIQCRIHTKEALEPANAN